MEFTTTGRIRTTTTGVTGDITTGVTATGDTTSIAGDIAGFGPRAIFGSRLKNDLLRFDRRKMRWNLSGTKFEQGAEKFAAMSSCLRNRDKTSTEQVFTEKDV